MVGRWILVVLFCGFLGAATSWLVNALFGIFSGPGMNQPRDMGGLALSMGGDTAVRAISYSAILNGIAIGVLAGCVIVIADAMVISRQGVKPK